MRSGGLPLADPVDLLDVLARTADGMVAVGPEGRIVAWNAAAAELLGHTEAEVLGRPCFEVLAWEDRCRNAVCSAGCSGHDYPGEGELVRTREVIAHARSGRALWLSVSTVVPPPGLRERCRVVHLFREVSLPPELERLVADRLQSLAAPESPNGAALATLTAREREILRLLAEGLGTREIAARLVLSSATIRNHVQHALEKLGAHSRAEAVAIALRSRV